MTIGFSKAEIDEINVQLRVSFVGKNYRQDV